MKFYIMPVFGCTDPEALIGPYKTFDRMLKRAQKVYAKQREEDAIFWVLVKPNGRPEVGSFANVELTGKYER